MSDSPRVLLVEDNPITRKLVRFVFDREGYQLSEAPDGATAVQMMRSHRPHLVLQDLLLPDMDGFELVRRLRELPSSQDIPILAFSGFLSPHDEKRLAESGFTDFVTKPIEPSQLLRIVRAYLPSSEVKPRFGGGRRVLLADDDDVQRKLSVFRLTRLGFDVVGAADGHSALEAARAVKPDLIVTDAMMPGMDGFELCAAVRQDPTLNAVPIVLLTSTYVDDADRELGRTAGANMFVIRTPGLSEMVDAVSAVLLRPVVTLPAAGQPEFERQRASRVTMQLERQVTLAAAARQQCALLSAEVVVLNAISEAITGRDDIDLVLKEILAACCDAGGVSVGALCLIEPDGSFRSLTVGPTLARSETESFADSLPRLREILALGKPEIFTETKPADTSVRDWLGQRGLKSALIVPLRHKDRLFGALAMMSDLVDLSVDNRAIFVEAVANQVSVALALTTAFKDAKVSERAARDQADLLESVFSSITDPIVVVDESGRPSTWNPAAGSLFGLDRDESLSIKNDQWSQFVGAFRNDKMTPFGTEELPSMRALAGETVLGLEVYLKNERQPSGAWLSVTARPLLDEQGGVRGAVTVSRDVTAEKLAHEQLLIADRMASVGMLAASVGHEINNPLACVTANLEMATADLNRLSTEAASFNLGDLPAEIAEALDAAQRVRRIARDLKIFSSGADEQPLPIDVESVLESAIRLASHQIRQCARVVRRYTKVPMALGAEARLGQVFLNLIVNAVQAIPEGDIDHNEIRVGTRIDGQQRVVVDVEDTGGGIPPHVMSQLFTAFVTTKPVGIGTGLGLSICHRLVTAMGGEIWAESTPGQGTSFHVALVAAKPAAVIEKTAPIAASQTQAVARVLVVDDEEMIGTIIRRALKACEVTATTNAAAALAGIRAGARYNAIFCDMMMPGMSGIDFYHALKQVEPDQAAAVVFLTGGAVTKAAKEFLESVENDEMPKPFGIQDLKDAVEARGAGCTGDAQSGGTS